MERRLAAILAADMVGYTSLVERDETGTLERLKRLRIEFIQPLISRHRGRLVKQMGDGFLIEFGSAVNAAQCAFDWQDRFQGLGDNADIRFRIGLHVGDILLDEGDILGEGVNIAARLEEIAPVGGVAMSSAFHDQVAGKVTATMVCDGSHQLKNIERPVEIWTIKPGTSDDAGINQVSQVELTRDAASMAVLPFANLTGDTSQDYLALGIADQLATDLGHVPWFFVSAQVASFAPVLNEVTNTKIGQRLGVRYLIEGALQKAGSRLRISVRLIETELGHQLWSRTYSGAEDEIFELQDKLAETVIGEIEPRMRQIEIRRSEAKHGNLSAFDFYLRALPHIRGMTQDEFDKGLSLLNSALEHYPDYPAAHGLIAWLMTLRVPQGHSVELDRGIHHAEQALRHGAFDSEALSTGGYALGFFRWDLDLGLQHLREALSLNPNSARTHDFTGWLLLYAGRATDALGYFEDSLRLSPIDDFAFRPLAGRAFALLFLKQPEDAVATARRALRANPNFTVCHRVLAPALVQIGSNAEASSIISDLLERHPTLTVSRFSKETRFVDPDYKDMLLDGLREAGLPNG